MISFYFHIQCFQTPEDLERRFQILKGSSIISNTVFEKSTNMDLEMSVLGDDFFEHLDDDATQHEPAPPNIQIQSHSIDIGLDQEVSY